MGLTSIGDLAQSFILKRQNGQLKSELDRLTIEASSGKTSDVGRQLRGDFQPLAAVDATLARLDGYAQVVAQTANAAGALQSVLSRVDDVASNLAPDLLRASTLGGGINADAVGRQARQDLETAVSALNTRYADRSLLAGRSTQGPALIGADALMAAALGATGGATTPAELQTALSTWFGDPAGFQAAAYLGGDALVPVFVAQGQTANIDVTALDPALRETLMGLVMGAMLDQGVFAGDTAARADLAGRAGASLIESASDRADLAARLGTVEGQLADVQARNATEQSALQLARNASVGADPYETATRLQETQNQLETLYALTARITRLSLVDFL
jgi:flagellar hook-associated protein 3 FlgL